MGVHTPQYHGKNCVFLRKTRLFEKEKRKEKTQILKTEEVSGGPGPPGEATERHETGARGKCWALWAQILTTINEDTEQQEKKKRITRQQK